MLTAPDRRTEPVSPLNLFVPTAVIIFLVPGFGTEPVIWVEAGALSVSWSGRMLTRP